VARQWLLDTGACAERVLRPEDLRRARRIAVANSVRGVLAAIPPDDTPAP
jgi:branched-subunit amino acid aminotransferase/4-amino-4-deoxychorismate lyase